MARFFGCNLEKKKHLNLPVLAWLKKLPTDFSVFVELEGSDFSVDFLVIKKYGIFNVEAKHWRVREAHFDANWVMADGESFPNPFLEQVLDQCQKIADYLIVQRDTVFEARFADSVIVNRQQLRIFPVVALSYPGIAPIIDAHPWRRTFADDVKLRRHLTNFEWFRDRSDKPIAMEPNTIAKLASLFHLEEIDPTTLKPLNAPVAPAAEHLAPIAKGPAIDGNGEPINPYQYTYVVTGGDFYGREMELKRIRRALEQLTPVAIVGLQRTGKSSLALESIRRLTHNNPVYSVIKFDFRMLKSEGPNPDMDLAGEFARNMVIDPSSAGGLKEFEAYREGITKRSHAEQRQLFRQILLKNRERNRRVVVFLDECQDISDFLTDQRYSAFVAYLDALCRDKELGLSVIIAFRPPFLELPPIKTLNLCRIFNMVYLGALEEDAATEIIRRGSKNLKFDSAAEQRLQCLTGRHPFWVQLMCHELFENAVLKQDFMITAGKVDCMFDKLSNDPGSRPRFYLLYQEAESDPFTFSLLKSIASTADREGEFVPLSTIMPEWKTEPKVSPALRSLADNQIIQIEYASDRPCIRFQVEALRKWMRSHLLTM
jgi:hypothetical protein